jgi:hypothetical protein
MSADLVDDLHNAEDTIGMLGAAIAELRRQLEEEHRPLVAADDLAAVLGHLADLATSYCRASCEGEPGDWSCDSDCGCPAHADDPTHGEA